jgi:hypothetical protein
MAEQSRSNTCFTGSKATRNKLQCGLLVNRGSMSYLKRSIEGFKDIHLLCQMSVAAGALADVTVIYFASPDILRLAGIHIPLRPWPAFTCGIAAVAFLVSFGLAIGNFWKSSKWAASICLGLSFMPWLLLYLIYMASGPGVNQ